MVKNAKVVDLFCGIGGLSHGFVKSGFNVVAGIDNDSSCKYGYEVNNGAKFFDADITDVTPDQLNEMYGDVSGMKILVGCAPCQPFSKLNTKDVTDQQLQPLEKFAQLITDTQPDIVSMENVKGLLKNPVFQSFLDNLDDNGYQYSYGVIDFSDYGVPQKRLRLVLLASKHGDIKLIEPTHKEKKKTVRDVIGKIEPINDGETSKKDSLHKARLLSPLNKKRIKATPKDGGNSRSWSDDLVLDCHKKDTGNTYRGTVYGRMRWDEPSPTMTTQCTGIGNGRYGHPEQDRAISLREAALFQTFPKSYKFIHPSDEIVTSKLARFIGNAVPVRAGEIIAKSIEKHMLEVNESKKT